MRTSIYSQFGTPAEVLRVETRDKPEPGPGQVRIRLLLSPIHNHDLTTISGRYGIKPALPAVPGTEAVGVVDALGPGVTGLVVGQRVAGGSRTWADYYLGEASRLVPVPDSVDDETAAQLVSMPLSALFILHHMGVQPGEWVVQNVANGLVGKLVARFGREKGINVVGLVRRQAAVEELAALGIDRVVSTDQPDWRAQVARITDGARVGYGIESIGGAASLDLASVVGEKGTIYSFGAMSGQPLQVSADTLLFRDITVKGFWLAKLLPATDPALVGAMIGELVTKAAAGELKLPAGAIFGLDDVAKAVAASGEPGRPGKVMIRP